MYISLNWKMIQQYYYVLCYILIFQRLINVNWLTFNIMVSYLIVKKNKSETR
jgi:hypothetical protein